jgi:predicted component of type VI protein secretion system
MGPGIDGSAFPLMGEEMVLGRERGDILFSDDGYVSGTHAKLSVREDGYFLTDLGSSNGTFVRLIEPRVVPTGTYVLMGQQLFRIDQV